MIWIRPFLSLAIFVSCYYCLEPVSTTVYFSVTTASAAIYAASSFMSSVFYEYCNQEKQAIIAKNWIKYDAEEDLRKDFKKKLYGQHLAQSIVVKAITKHMNDKQPRKALVLSFHGWTGGGKNFVSYLIARNLYKLGLESKYVHVISATEKFPDSTKTNEYKVQLIKQVKEQLDSCGRQLFIFDEVDKVPGGVIDGLAPFLEYTMAPKEQNKAIYIFLSNTGGGEITRITYSFYVNGMNREEIGLQDIESLIDLHAFNEEGGLRKSSLIHKSLIDFFIPFLPLEKIHVQNCIVDYLQEKYNVTRSVHDKFVVNIANQLDYFPADSKVYSKSGCKKVARKVDQFMD